MLAPGLANLEWRRCVGLGMFAGPFWPLIINHFGFLTKKTFVLRADVASAALAAWQARSEAAWAAAGQALVGGGGLADFGCLGGAIGSGLSGLEDGKLLFLGRTLLLWLWLLGRHVRRRLGRRPGRRWLVEAALVAWTARSEAAWAAWKAARAAGS